MQQVNRVINVNWESEGEWLRYDGPVLKDDVAENRPLNEIRPRKERV